MTMKKPIEIDTECYVNYWLFKAHDGETGKMIPFEMYPGKMLNAAGVQRVMREYTTYGFNTRNYDHPMIAYALLLATQKMDSQTRCAKLKELSDAIIKGGLKPRDAEKRYGFIIPRDWDFVDLIEVAPGVATSLKLYGGRMHAKKLQELPIPPDTRLDAQQMVLINTYCGNDLVTTHDLRLALKQELELRDAMSIEYGLDLRSKSDAQIAEAVLRKQMAEMLGLRSMYDLPEPDRTPYQTFKYKAPEFIKFRTPQLQSLLAEIEAATFITSENGSPQIPDALAGRDIHVAGMSYRMGIGGLHSTESSVSHYADDESELHDDDVISFYPWLIILCKLFPKHLGPKLISVYKTILLKRVAAKEKAGQIKEKIKAREAEIRELLEFAIEEATKQALAAELAGDKKAQKHYQSIANSLKIVLNGTFGKLGSIWSILYAPDLLIQVTVTGQLSLLMLIEMFDSIGVSVLSANTDGVVTRVPVARNGTKAAVIAAWEKLTGLETENTRYRSLHSRDVNNYVAVKLDGEVKLKGVFTPAGLMKNPANEIIAKAAADYLASGTPVDKTIRECTDIRMFLSVRTVKGGGAYRQELSTTHLTDDQALEAAGWVKIEDVKNRYRKVGGNMPQGLTHLMASRAAREELSKGETRYLGKIVRWYRCAGKPGYIEYISNGNRVPLTENAWPLMDLPDEFPNDIDYDWYIKEARDLLIDVGAGPKVVGHG